MPIGAEQPSAYAEMLLGNLDNACFMFDRSTDREAGDASSASSLTFSFATLATALGLFGCTPSNALEGHPFCTEARTISTARRTVGIVELTSSRYIFFPSPFLEKKLMVFSTIGHAMFAKGGRHHKVSARCMDGLTS